MTGFTERLIQHPYEIAVGYQHGSYIARASGNEYGKALAERYGDILIAQRPIIESMLKTNVEIGNVMSSQENENQKGARIAAALDEFIGRWAKVGVVRFGATDNDSFGGIKQDVRNLRQIHSHIDKKHQQKFENMVTHTPYSEDKHYEICVPEQEVLGFLKPAFHLNDRHPAIIEAVESLFHQANMDVVRRMWKESSENGFMK